MTVGVLVHSAVLGCWGASSEELLLSAGWRSGLWFGNTRTLIGSLSCFTTHFTVLWYNSECIALSVQASSLGPDAAQNQTQTVILPSPCFGNGVRFLTWDEVFLHQSFLISSIYKAFFPQKAFRFVRVIFIKHYNVLLGDFLIPHHCWPPDGILMRSKTKKYETGL